MQVFRTCLVLVRRVRAGGGERFVFTPLSAFHFGHQANFSSSPVSPAGGTGQLWLPGFFGMHSPARRGESAMTYAHTTA